MTKSKLYTRTGDAGTTSLVWGSRISKNCCRLEAYGTVDEFSSFVGCVLADNRCDAVNRERLVEVQNMLFNVGGYLACEPERAGSAADWGLTHDRIEHVEEWTDMLDEATPKVNAFVLPSGCELAAKTHVARSVCRRAERRILQLAEEAEVDADVLCYINRLSDFLFILARHFNHVAGVAEITWHKE